MNDEQSNKEMADVVRERRARAEKWQDWIGKLIGGVVVLLLIVAYNNPDLTAAILEALGFNRASAFLEDWQRDQKITADNNRPTVDVSFSLTCRVLESRDGGDILLPWSTAIQQWETDPTYRTAGWGVKYYDTGALIAFNHGIGDGESHWSIGHMRVVEATPEAITLGGLAWDGDERSTGLFNRRTGYGDIRYYNHVERDPKTDKYVRTFNRTKGVEGITKQFIFQCEPSKPAKF
jgi:hypothetical protein